MRIGNSVRFILKFISWFCAFVAFELLTGAVRFYSVTIDVPCMFVKYMLLACFLINRRKLNVNKAIAYLSVFYLLLFILVSFMQGELPLFTLPNFLSGILGIIYGFIISKKGMKGIKILIPFIVGIFSVWYIFGKGFDHWCQLINGNTFTGKVKPTNIDSAWKVYDRNNDKLTSNNYKDKIVYLDFWSTSCGVCFAKFPELEALYQKYKNDHEVLIQAVNIPIERDTAGMAFYMIERNGKFNFPVVIGTDAMRRAFGVQAYPTVIILKDNKIVFRGRTELAVDALDDIIARKN